MEAEIVIQHYLDKYQTNGTTMSDIKFDCLPFLYAQEPDYNMKGCKVSKSYYDKRGREAVRIVYKKIVGDFHYDGVIHNNVFLGMGKSILYFNCAGEIVTTKTLQPYYFKLQPVFIGDGTETIIGFSSQKQRKILKEERYAADEWLNAQNPNLYAMLYAKYGAMYQYYLRTGYKEELINAFDSETDQAIVSIFNNEVFGMEPMTIKELIILNLQ